MTASTLATSPIVQGTARRQAAALIASQLGLNPSLRSSWSTDQRVSYDKALAAYIQTNPDKFSTQDQQIAAGVAAANLEPASLPSSLSVFESEFGNQALAAGDKIAGVGRGVLNTASIAAWIIPLAAVAAVVILLFGLKKKVA